MSNTALVNGYQDQLKVDSEEEFVVSGLEVAESLLNPRAYICASMAYSYTCPRCGEKVQKPRLCGNRWECPICARIYAKTKGRDLFVQLQGTKARFYRELVFTYSEEVIELLFHGLSYDEISKRVVKGVAGFLKRWFGEGVGFVCASHGWASIDPLGAPHWHVHVLMPCLRWDEKRGRWVHLEPWIADFMLEELRKAWGRFNGVSWLWVWHEYWSFDQIGKFRHKCSYILRRPVLDINDFCLKHDIKKFTPQQKARFVELCLHPRSYRNTGRFGFLAYGVFGKTLRSRGSSSEKVKAVIAKLRETENRVYCPFCHFDLTEVVKAGSFIYEKTELNRVMHRKMVWGKFREVLV